MERNQAMLDHLQEHAGHTRSGSHARKLDYDDGQVMMSPDEAVRSAISQVHAWAQLRASVTDSHLLACIHS
jgi:hypothetical protein